MPKQIFLLGLYILIASHSGLAATITVEKDGSGDFTQIQRALDAAADGDTVLIGPGEFTELIPSYIPGYAWDVEVCAYVRVPNLTIIGDGPDQTILGPVTPQGSYQSFSPKGMVWLEGNDRIVSGITFRNFYEGIHVTNGPIVVENCEFKENRGYGIIWHSSSSGGVIRGSRFSSSFFGNYGIAVFGPGANVIVEECVFDGCEANVKNIQEISFVNCIMKNTQVGVNFSAGARGDITSCQIYDCSVAGVVLAGVGPHCNIINSSISGGEAALAAYSGATVTARGSTFEGGSFAAIYLKNTGPAVISGSHVLHSTSFAVRCSQHESYGSVIHEMKDNFWGIDDPGHLAELIWDQNDDPANYSMVNYLPMANGPVPTEDSTWGSLKAMFR